MKPYMKLSGKGLWNYFWGDKVKNKFKKIFQKSQRQENKKLCRNTD